MSKITWRSKLPERVKRFVESIASPEVLHIVQRLEENHVPHEEYLRVKKLLHAHAALAPQGTVIVMTGPGRTGKSRVSSSLEHELVATAPSSNSIPLISTEAVAGRAQEQMKYLNLRLLTACKHPVYAVKSLEPGYRPRVSASEHVLRLALEETIVAREVVYGIVDECHHLTQTHSDKLAGTHVDSLKSLANVTGIVLILVCGYPLITGKLSAHFTGRVLPIHFRRYRIDRTRERQAYCAGLDCLSKELPLQPGTALLDFADFLGAGSLGCFGATITWSYAALAQMIATNARYLRPEHYKATRFAVQIEENERDIERGEEAVRLFEGWLEENQGEESASDTQGTGRAKRERKPFQRTPRRLRVGR